MEKFRLSSQLGEILEKSRQVGEKKVGADGITREWIDRGNGTFGWRRVRGEKKGESKTDMSKRPSTVPPNEVHKQLKDHAKGGKKGLSPRKRQDSEKTPSGTIIPKSSLQGKTVKEVRSFLMGDQFPNDATVEVTWESGDKMKQTTVKKVRDYLYDQEKQDALARIKSIELVDSKKQETSKTNGDRKRIRKMRQMKKEVVTREDGAFEYDNNGSKFFSKPDESMKSFIERIEPDVVFKKKVGVDKSKDISFDDFKDKMIEKFSGYKMRESSGIGGKIVSFSKHVRGEDSSFDIQEQNNENTAGKFYVNMLTKKEVSSRSLADPSKNYQTTSARVVKHKKTHTRKYADTLENVEKIINSHMKKIGEEIKKGIDELSIQKAKETLEF